MRLPNKRPLKVILIIGLWLMAMGWLVFYEAYPELRQHTASGYRTLLAQGVMIMDRWMTISFQGKPIGYTHTSVDVGEGDGANLYRINNRTVLTLPLMGSQQRIAVNADAEVDALYKLRSFSFALTSTGYAIHVDGVRKQGNLFDVTIKGIGSTQRFSVTLPEGAVIYSPMMEMTLKSLNPGDETAVQIFNPVTLTAQNVTVRALRREELIHQGKSIPTTVLSAKIDGMDTLSWIDRQGLMLKQETPFGWTIESCEAKDALAAGGKLGENDMLAALAVPLQGEAALLTSEPSVKLRLTGVAFSRKDLETQRQTVVSLESNTVEIIVRAETLPTSSASEAAISEELKPWLAASPFIQSHDPRLINKAREITGSCTNRLEAALAIYRWVFTQVAKKPTVSLPSALDVLENPQGDCNEHTYLFTGLARAAGLPCKIRVGLTLHEGRLYYHAWPSVYIDRWLDMDPTRGLPAVNTGYLSLLEGELAEQMKLMSIIGKLKVEVERNRIKESGFRSQN